MALFPNETLSNIGRIRFINTPFKALELRLWKDEIVFVYPELGKDELVALRGRLSELKAEIKLKNQESDIFFTFNSSSCSTAIKPLNKMMFQDTEIGMMQRATHYVLIANLCLKCFNFNKE